MLPSSGGAMWNHRGVCGRWSPARSRDHINLPELRAVFLALQYFLPVLAGRHVLVRSDNTLTVFHLNHQGGTKLLKSLHLTHKVLTWSLPWLALLRAVCLLVSSNQVADALSRDLLHPGEWRLHPDVVHRIWQQFGKAEVDLFATEVTTHCHLWFARTETSSPLGQDAQSHEWPKCLLYAFPPLPLLWETMHRISLCKHSVTYSAPIVSHTLVSHASITIGGQARQLFGSRFGRICCHRWMTSGSDILLNDCEPTIVHTIICARLDIVCTMPLCRWTFFFSKIIVGWILHTVSSKGS